MQNTILVLCAKFGKNRPSLERVTSFCAHPNFFSNPTKLGCEKETAQTQKLVTRSKLGRFFPNFAQRTKMVFCTVGYVSFSIALVYNWPYLETWCFLSAKASNSSVFERFHSSFRTEMRNRAFHRSICLLLDIYSLELAAPSNVVFLCKMAVQSSGF